MDLVINDDIENIIQESIPWIELRNKSILITGANGFIGSYIIYTLIKLNEKFKYNIRIIALCRNYEKAKKRFGDIGQEKGLELLIQDIKCDIPEIYKSDIIIHAASPANNLTYAKNPYEVIKTNLIGCENLLNRCLQWNVQQMVVFSSSAVYGLRDEFRKDDEKYRGRIDFDDTKQVYSMSKQMVEMLLSVFKEKNNFTDIKILRPFLVYGPGDCYCTGKAITDFIKNSICNEKIYVKSKLDFYRSYVYISDMISALFYIMLLGSEEAYNISNDKNVYSVRELAHYIARINGSIEVSEKEINEKKFLIGNNDKLKRLGWNSKIDLYTGLERTIDWAKNSDLFLDKEM